MKRLLRVYVTDVRVSIVLLFIEFYLLETMPFDPDATYWLNSQPVIEIGNIKLGQLYISGRSYYLGLGVWLIPSFIYNLYKRRLKEIAILLVAFCIPMFIHGTSISYDLVDYKMNIEKYLEPRTEKDKLGWLLLGRDKQVISGIYSKRPIRFRHNRAVVAIDNNWDVSISGNDITIVPDTNQCDYKGTSYVYIDTLGKLASPQKFQEIKLFYDYGFIIGRDSFYGIIDTSGKEILPFEYDDINTDFDGVYGYHLLEKNMQYGLFCDSNHSVLLNDCSCINFWMRDIDSCIFTKNGKDSLLLLSTRTKTPFEWHKHELQFDWNIELIDTIIFSLKENANTIREIIVNRQDSLPKLQIIHYYLYDDYWGNSYMNISNHWRKQYFKDTSNLLYNDFQEENKLYNEWWRFHEHTFSTIHELPVPNQYDYIPVEELNIERISRLIYSYFLRFNEKNSFKSIPRMNRQFEFSKWNNSIIDYYNDFLQRPEFSPMAIRHINNEKLKWEQLIEYKFNLLNKIFSGDYPLTMKQLLYHETKDLLLVQLQHMRQLYLDIPRCIEEYQNNGSISDVKIWLEPSIINSKINQLRLINK